ncbi:ABC transporter permease subunit [Candidatus Sororendozoicomonas aggregata]|uniref:amino acid ABC transporter permease n=1 Tax=Candidatus Sororendozoicomonas aggregata TaxID=3073239 RepID=UPI002ED02D83
MWRNVRLRGLFIQVIVIALLLLAGGWIIHNTLNNLESRGITTGFGFLTQQAGFGIIQSLVPYDESHTFARTFVVGLLNTLLVSFLGIILATVLGFFIGIARLSSNWLLARLAGAYIEVFRNIPLLLQILFWYFAVLAVLPSPRQSLALGDSIFINIRGLFVPDITVHQFGLLGLATLSMLIIWQGLRKTALKDHGQLLKGVAALVLMALPWLFWLATDGFVLEKPVLKGFNFTGGIQLLPELCALLLALSIYTAAFIGEVVRSGIESVSKGQTEAAQALGLKDSKILSKVVIPQAMRVIIPPLTNQYLNLAKNSSLATAIGYPDLVNVFAGTTLNQTGQAVEVIAMTMAVYLTMSLLVSVFMNLYNRRMALVER